MNNFRVKLHPPEGVSELNIPAGMNETVIIQNGRGIRAGGVAYIETCGMWGEECIDSCNIRAPGLQKIR
jgi:hypothetical protein